MFFQSVMNFEGKNPLLVAVHSNVQVRHVSHPQPYVGQHIWGQCSEWWWQQQEPS